MEMPQIETFSDPSVFLKMIEFLLTLIAISVEQGGQAFFGDLNKEFFGGGVLVMSFVVTSLLFLCYIFNGQSKIQATFFEIAFNGLTSILILTAGAIVIDTYHGYSSVTADHANTAGAFCIMNSIVYAIDTYFAYVSYKSISMLQSNPSTTAPPPANII